MSSNWQLIDNDFLCLIFLFERQDSQKLNNTRYALKTIIIQSHQIKRLDKRKWHKLHKRRRHKLDKEKRDKFNKKNDMISMNINNLTSINKITKNTKRIRSIYVLRFIVINELQLLVWIIMNVSIQTFVSSDDEYSHWNLSSYQTKLLIRIRKKLEIELHVSRNRVISKYRWS